MPAQRKINGPQQPLICKCFSRGRCSGVAFVLWKASKTEVSWSQDDCCSQLLRWPLLVHPCRQDLSVTGFRVHSKVLVICNENNQTLAQKLWSVHIHPCLCLHSATVKYICTLRSRWSSSFTACFCLKGLCLDWRMLIWLYGLIVVTTSRSLTFAGPNNLTLEMLCLATAKFYCSAF